MGCATEGPRRILRFGTETRNIGQGDLVIGNPATNPLYALNSCFNQYTMAGFAQYRLVDQFNVVVASTNKSAFCLLDNYKHDPSAGPAKYQSCSNQGISAGWADRYGDSFFCQNIDITEVLAGAYTLEMETNPDRRMMESDYSNNVTQLTVVIPPIDDAQMISHTVPAQMADGYEVLFDVTMRNSGNTIWMKDEVFLHLTATCPIQVVCLQSCDPGTQRMTLPDGVVIMPGESYAFRLGAEPSGLGPCTFTFQMERDDLGPTSLTEFGPAYDVPTTVVSPINDARFIEHTIPSTMTPGQALWVGITMRNDGTTAWIGGISDHALAVTDDQDCLMFDMVPRLYPNFQEQILPGEQKIFIGYLTAPSQPGSCTVRLRMVEEWVEFFGDEVAATVQVADPPNVAKAWTLYQ
jgi:hypothetical protein